MAITSDSVREIFKGFENGDGDAFFAKLSQVLPHGAQLHVEESIVKDDEAIVELHSPATAKNGMRFDNRYFWVVYSARA